MGYNGYDIEEGVELPPEYKSTAGRKPLYPFMELKIGQGFFTPDKLKRTMGATASYWAKKLRKDRGDKTVFATVDTEREGVMGCIIKRIK